MLMGLLHLASYILYLNGGFYYLYYNLLNRYNPIFYNLELEDKMYVVKNFTKSTILCFLGLISTSWLYDLINDGEWRNDRIHLIGSLYASTDIAGLIFVPNLPRRTKIHHSVVLFFGLLNLTLDYRNDGIHRALIVLTYFSIIPYLVNTLLGLRRLGFPQLKARLAFVSLIIYSICVGINFTYQNLYTLFYSQTIIALKMAYLFLYYLILYDDVKLLHYLYRVGFSFNK